MGIDEFDGLWKTFSGTVQRPDKRLAAEPDLLVVEGNHVVAFSREIADLPGLPSIGPQAIVNHLVFERGKIVFFETHFDTHMAAQQIRVWKEAATIGKPARQPKE